MTKLKQSLKNSVRTVLVFSFFFFACNFSLNYTYNHLEDIPLAIKDIAFKEYDINLEIYLKDKNLWVYIPIKNLFEPLKEPIKHKIKFYIQENKCLFLNSILKSFYKIEPTLKEEIQTQKISEDILEKRQKFFRAFYRVILSTNPVIKVPFFISLIIADIKNGFFYQEIFYLEDFKKYLYGFISPQEFSLRVPYEVKISSFIINDWKGENFSYNEIDWEEFITSQIIHRINLKFHEEEINSQDEINKEIIKIFKEIASIYKNEFNFSEVELNNLLTQEKINISKGKLLNFLF